MTFDIHHTTIRRELIRAFALVDEWIDHAEDLQVVKRNTSTQALNYLGQLVSETEFVLSSIRDYRFCAVDHSIHFDLDNSSVCTDAVFKNGVSMAKEDHASDTTDIGELRTRLRQLLLECLMLLEFPEEHRGCEVTLQFDERLDIHITQLVRIISAEVMNRIQLLNETPQNKPV